MKINTYDEVFLLIISLVMVSFRYRASIGGGEFSPMISTPYNLIGIHVNKIASAQYCALTQIRRVSFNYIAIFSPTFFQS